MDVHGNISHAMRDNYNEFGVDEVSNSLQWSLSSASDSQYYRKVAASYRNPFYPSIKQVCSG